MSSLLGHVNNVFNAVLVKGDIVGDTMYYGRGAGRAATSSAVVADILDLGLNLNSACVSRWPAFRQYQGYEKCADNSGCLARYYIRLQIDDTPGVLAQVSGIFGKYQISLASVNQKDYGVNSSTVPMVILTHQAVEANVARAIAEIGALSCVAEKPVVFRVENLCD